MAKREWKKIRDFEDLIFEEYNGIAKITINRPRYRNAFTPQTTLELCATSQCAGRADADTPSAKTRHRYG